MLCEKIMKKYDKETIEFLEELGKTMIRYYGDEYEEAVKKTINGVLVVKDKVSNDGLIIKYKGNSVEKYNAFKYIYINAFNGSNLFLIHEMVRALMSNKKVIYTREGICEKIGISTFNYSMNNYVKTLIKEDEVIDAHHEFEAAATEYDAMMIYNLMFPKYAITPDILSINARKAAILLEFPIARTIINEKRIKNDFLYSPKNDNSLTSDAELQANDAELQATDVDLRPSDADLQALRHFVMGFINNFPDRLKSYEDDMRVITDGTYDNTKTNKYEHLNRVVKALHRDEC